MPGTVISRWQLSSCFGQRLDLGGDGLDALVEPPPVDREVLEQTQDAWRDRRRIGGEDIEKRLAQGHRSLLHRDAALDQEAADLVDGARALTHQARAHLVQRQQVHLLRRLDAHEVHGRALHGLGNRFGIPVVVLVPLEERLDVLRRDQAHVMAERLQLPADVVGARAGLHADQAARDIGQPAFELAARDLLLQHNRAALVEADEVERGLADVDADRRDGGRRLRRVGAHRRLLELLLTPPSRCRSL